MRRTDDNNAVRREKGTVGGEEVRRFGHFAIEPLSDRDRLDDPGSAQEPLHEGREFRLRFDELIGAAQHALFLFHFRVGRNRRLGIRIEPDESDAAGELRAVELDVPEELRFRRHDDVLRRLPERELNEGRRFHVDANEIGDESVRVFEGRVFVFPHRAERFPNARTEPFVLAQ